MSIVFRKNEGKINVHPDWYYSINEVIIDMTGWKNNDSSKAQDANHPTYPYALTFKDSAGQMHTISNDDQSNNGMRALYEYCGNQYHTAASYGTRITIVCPDDVIDNQSSCGGSVFTTHVETYCKEGSNAIPFTVTKDNRMRERLESVLDYICHEATIDYIDTPKIRPAVFKNSIYSDTYTKEEASLYKQRTEHPEFDDRYFM